MHTAERSDYKLWMCLSQEIGKLKWGSSNFIFSIIALEVILYTNFSILISISLSALSIIMKKEE